MAARAKLEAGSALNVAPADRLAASALDVESLYRRFCPRVLVWAKHLGGPGVDCEDVAQEVFFRAHCQRDSGPEIPLLSTWLYRLTVNVVNHRRRRDHRWRQLLRRWTPPARATVPTPLETLESEQRERLIYQVLDSMRDRDRTLLIATRIEGLSARQVAELFGVAEGSIGAWLSRARQDFRRRLRNRGLIADE